jgi:hypothetical protein
VVDPATDAEQRGYGGGMEYPTLITCGSPLLPHPRQLAPEGVTVHEFGHQFWYGLSANNEFEESWLDEGINTYCAGRAQDLFYGARPRPPARIERFGALPLQMYRPFLGELSGRNEPRLPSWEKDGLVHGWLQHIPEPYRGSGAVWRDTPLLRFLREAPLLSYGREARTDHVYGDRAESLRAPWTDVMVRNGWEYLNRASYRNNSYHRPATLLQTLERIAGGERFWLFLRKLHEQSRFRQPTTAEFAALLEREIDAETAAFFRAAIDSHGGIDYGVESVHSQRLADGRVRNEVTVRRFGQLVAPVKVAVSFATHDPIEVLWSAENQYVWTRFVFEDRADETFGEVLEVRVDPPPRAGWCELRSGPAGVYVLDQNLLNNAWRRAEDPVPALARGVRALLTSQSLLSFFAVFG